MTLRFWIALLRTRDNCVESVANRSMAKIISEKTEFCCIAVRPQLPEYTFWTRLLNNLEYEPIESIFFQKNICN